LSTNIVNESEDEKKIEISELLSKITLEKLGEIEKMIAQTN
jgi:hypothetical protein